MGAHTRPRRAHAAEVRCARPSARTRATVGGIGPPVGGSTRSIEPVVRRPSHALLALSAPGVERCSPRATPPGRPAAGRGCGASWARRRVGWVEARATRTRAHARSRLRAATLSLSLSLPLPPPRSLLSSMPQPARQPCSRASLPSSGRSAMATMDTTTTTTTEATGPTSGCAAFSLSPSLPTALPRTTLLLVPWPPRHGRTRRVSLL
jgi:hypothetical protein